jgi:hypothetical protein
MIVRVAQLKQESVVVAIIGAETSTPKRKSRPDPSDCKRLGLIGPAKGLGHGVDPLVQSIVRHAANLLQRVRFLQCKACTAHVLTSLAKPLPRIAPQGIEPTVFGRAP